MIAQQQQRVTEILTPILDRQGAFLVDLTIRGERTGKVLTALIDTDTGISIGLCAEISRELGKELDTAGIISESYRLEVSSPGSDRPLKLLRQFPKNVGRKFIVNWRSDSGSQEFTGRLLAVEANVLAFEGSDPDALIKIEFERILAATEVLPW